MDFPQNLLLIDIFYKAVLHVVTYVRNRKTPQFQESQGKSPTVASVRVQTVCNANRYTAVTRRDPEHEKNRAP